MSPPPQANQSLWNFATDFYAQSDNRETFLRLQDDYGFDINLLLFSLWYGLYHGVIEEPLLRSLYECSRDWQRHAVSPLRETRRWLKSHIEMAPDKLAALTTLREQVKALELDCERRELEELEILAATVDASQVKGSELPLRQRCADNLTTLRSLMQSSLMQSSLMQNSGDAALSGLLHRLLQALPE